MCDIQCVAVMTSFERGLERQAIMIKIESNVLILLTAQEWTNKNKPIATSMAAANTSLVDSNEGGSVIRQINNG
jgi:hypothetical protein